MNVSTYILNYLVNQGVTTIFGIQGGFIAPLFDAFHGRTDIKYICTQHEQAAAMAADGYARFAGLGCAIATSGPGATNLITGIAASWFDSIPVIYITGQVPTYEARGKSGVRQRGFQETDIVSIVRPITKLARQVTDAGNIQFALEQAAWLAQSGRPGPVLLDIPMDVLRAKIDPDTLIEYAPAAPEKPHIDYGISETVKLIAQSKRPVVVYGQGARHARVELLQFIVMTGIPCLPSWAALDLVSHDHPLYVDTFGVYGSRAGNLAVQNADLIIAIGTRLDGRMTGNPSKFAPGAKLVQVDIDRGEMEKTCKPNVTICADALDFLRAIRCTSISIATRLPLFGWYDRIAAWKQKYPMVTPLTPAGEVGVIQPLNFICQLCGLLLDDAIIVTDSGANLSWAQQAMTIRGNQRTFSDFGFSAMGYALPAAIGAHYATGKPIIAITGDGGMQMNIQELQTLAHYDIPVKVFILNNHSYGIIKQFQEELYESRYEATDEAGGYSSPDFQRVAAAYGIRCLRILNNTVAGWMSAEALKYPGPCVCDVDIDPAARIFPKVQFGNALDNQSPLLPEDEHAENVRNE